MLPGALGPPIPPGQTPASSERAANFLAPRLQLLKDGSPGLICMTKGLDAGQGLLPCPDIG